MSHLEIANLGEELVAQWLQYTGWEILQRQFSCRWGEIDIIAQHTGNIQEPILAFVEVKTRSLGSWDNGGRGAITLKKQAKIERTARMFLAKYPEKSDYICRFDVAIVNYQLISQDNCQLALTQEPVASASFGKYQFQLQEYISAAFDYCHN
jgi:putative endonuclease